MNKILSVLILLTLSFGIASGQTPASFQKKIITASGSYYPSSFSGKQIGFGIWRPISIPGKKLPVIIHLHGIGEITTSTTIFADTTTASGVDKLDDGSESFSYGIPYHAKAHLNTLKFKQPNGDSTRFIVIAPQCARTYGYWIRGYVIEMLKYIKANMANEVDTTRIYLAGLSLGGGGVLVAITDPTINSQIAAALAVAPGYHRPLSYPSDPSDWQMMARSGMPLWLVHSRDDGVTNSISGTSPLDYTLHSQAAADSMNKFRALYPYRYDKLIGYSHTSTWDIIYNPTMTTGRNTINGYQIVYGKSIYEWFLQFSTAQTRKPIGAP